MKALSLTNQKIWSMQKFLRTKKIDKWTGQKLYTNKWTNQKLYAPDMPPIKMSMLHQTIKLMHSIAWIFCLLKNKINSHYLPENKWLLIIHRVDTIILNSFSTELFPVGVCGKSIHVYFYVRTNPLVC